jgi:hypothetical protein
MEEEKGRPDPKRVRAPEFDACLDVFITALGNPNRSLLSRVFFVAEDKSKYVSVGYYPARGYQPLAEFGGAKKLPLLVNDQQLRTMAANIAALCHAVYKRVLYEKGRRL